MTAVSTVKRIAMWSGPRNISTAMMRAWENRADTAVVDEPFYACYLTTAKLVHPMQEEVLASQSNDWNEVIRSTLRRALRHDQVIQYQKHMTHHMVGDIDEEWFSSVSHAFLIRHPAAVAASYSQKRDSLCAEDIGFKRQKELFDMACQNGDLPPPVVESRSVLMNPHKTLSALCTKLGVPFDNNMLKWPSGKRVTDGAWAPHWYQAVEQSTGFSPYKEKSVSLTAQLQQVVNESLPYYEAMAEHAIVVD